MASLVFLLHRGCMGSTGTHMGSQWLLLLGMEVSPQFVGSVLVLWWWWLWFCMAHSRRSQRESYRVVHMEILGGMVSMALMVSLDDDDKRSVVVGGVVVGGVVVGGVVVGEVLACKLWWVQVLVVMDEILVRKLVQLELASR